MEASAMRKFRAVALVKNCAKIKIVWVLHWAYFSVKLCYCPRPAKLFYPRSINERSYIDFLSCQGRMILFSGMYSYSLRFLMHVAGSPYWPSLFLLLFFNILSSSAIGSMLRLVMILQSCLFFYLENYKGVLCWAIRLSFFFPSTNSRKIQFC